MNISPAKLPSAIAPVVMSMAALALIVVHVVRYGIVREVDEGTSAHLFQLLMALQAPVIVFFAFKWLPVAPRQGLIVLAVQLFAAFLAFAALFLMERAA
ncbi:MAG: hypothetical protein ABI565_02030 [Vicinamibacteria bacterium]